MRRHSFQQLTGLPRLPEHKLAAYPPQATWRPTAKSPARPEITNIPFRGSQAVALQSKQLNSTPAALIIASSGLLSLHSAHVLLGLQAVPANKTMQHSTGLTAVVPLCLCHGCRYMAPAMLKKLPLEGSGQG